MLQEFVDLVIEKQLKVHGIRVIQGGSMIARYDFSPCGRHPIYSATKSFTSTAVGLAMEESDLALEDSILNYLEEELPKNCKTKVKDILEKITLKRLLTMSVAGYPFRPEGEDWLTYSLTYPLDNVEAQVFSYSNIPAYLVGVIVEKVVGMKFDKYLETRLLSPLDMKKVEFAYCPRGHYYGASGIQLTVDDLAKLGQLYLQQGFWNGKSVLSAHWVREATSKQIETKENGYGYYFWRCSENGYMISGKWGQQCYVFPEKELVVAYLAYLPEEVENKFVSRSMYETILSKL